MTKLVVDGAAKAPSGAKSNSKQGGATAERQVVVDPLAGLALAAPAKAVAPAKVGALPAMPGKVGPHPAANKIVKNDGDAEDERLVRQADDGTAAPGEGEHLVMVDATAAAAVGMMAAEAATAQSGDAGGSEDDDGGNNTALIIGGLALVGGGVALAAGGGGSSSPANSPPTAAAQTNAATEDAAKVSGKLAASDSNNDTLSFAVKTGSTAPAGFAFVGTDGSYTFDPAHADYQSLGAGKTKDAVVNFTVSDGKGGSADSTLTIKVTGVNDTATIAGTKTGVVTEDSAATTTTGALTVADVDAGENVFVAQTATKGAYGSLGITTAGAWTYTIDNSLDAVQALGAGVQKTDSFVVKSSDGTASETVTVTVTGANDAATIAGTKTGVVTEDAATTTATGSLAVTDKDAGENIVVAQTAAQGTYGTFKITAAGAWTYTIDNALTATQALAAGVQKTETFTVQSFDGTASETVTVTVTGANDQPSFLSGTAGTAIAENAAAGTVVYAASVQDVDVPDTKTYSLSGRDAALFSVDANGAVTLTGTANYEASLDHAYQFTLTVKDGANEGASQNVTGTITDVVDIFTGGTDLGVSGGAPVTLDAKDGGSAANLTDVNFRFVETPTAQSNVKIVNFTSNDQITFSGADADDYDYALVATADPNSDDLLITHLSGSGVDSQILLVGVLANGAAVNSAATAEAALDAKLGAGNYLVGSALPVTIALDPLNGTTVDAAGKAATFTDNPTLNDSVVIANFRADDVIAFSALPGGSTVNFALSQADTHDLEIRVDTAGAVNIITLDEALPDGVFVFDEASAQAALGRQTDFITFA